MHIFIKRAARQLSPFLSLKNHVPDPSLLVRHPRQRHAAAREWSAGIYLPGTLANLPVLYDGVQASPVPTMFTPTIAFEPNKGIREVVDCSLQSPVRTQRGELIDQLPCNLAAMFLCRNPGHCLSGSAAKIAAD